MSSSPPLSSSSPSLHAPLLSAELGPIESPPLSYIRSSVSSLTSSDSQFHRPLDLPDLSPTSVISSDGHDPLVLSLGPHSLLLTSPQATPFSLSNLSGLSKSFLLLVFLESLLLTCLCLVALAIFSSSHSHKSSLISLASTLGFLYFSFDAVIRESRFQFLSSISSHLLIVLYVCYHYFTGNLDEFSLFQSVSLMLAILIVTCQLVYLGMANAILRSFGWRIFKDIGSSDIQLARMYEVYLLFLTLLKVNAFLSSLLLIFAAVQFSGNWTEIGLLCLVGFSIVIILLIGLIAVQAENRALLNTFMFLEISLVPAFMSWKLSQLKQTGGSDPQSNQQFLITALVSMACKIALLFVSWKCGKQFDKGLKDCAFLRENKFPNVTREQQAEESQTVQ